MANSSAVRLPSQGAHTARTVSVVKRALAAGYAGLDNELFYMDKTMMVFGDARKGVADIVKAIDQPAGLTAAGVG